jgi:hypothetical protein
MDTSAEEISFNEEGVCSFCISFARENEADLKSAQRGQKKKDLETLLEKVKSFGNSREYDSILGLSGGGDSSYTALLTVKNMGYVH